MGVGLSLKSDRAIGKLMARFLHRNFLSYRRPTHEGSTLPQDFLEKKDTFRNTLESMQKEYHVPDRRIINMNEAPLYFIPSVPYVVDAKGAKSVHVSSSKINKKRVTLVLAGTMLISKGGIEKTVHKSLLKIEAVKNKRILAICNEKAWNGILG